MIRMKPRFLSGLGMACLFPAVAAGAEPRPLRVDDLYTLKVVRDPRVSPDGKWVAYTVTGLDAKEDAADADVYMSPLAGGDAERVTASKKSETAPRWSPDGRYLAFLSGREGKKTQVWLLPRLGGEAVKLTDYKGSVSDLAWSPDGTRLALVVSDTDPDDPDSGDADTSPADAKKKPKPVVLRRLQFKRDGEGYLREIRRHLHVFDVARKTTVQVTSGAYDDSQPAWSPDGQSIVFTSNRTENPDANVNTDVFVVAARAGETPRALTSSPGADRSPAVSPDGRSVAYLAGGDPKDIWYGTNHLAVVPFAGGPSRPLTAGLDRNVSAPRFDPS